MIEVEWSVWAAPGRFVMTTELKPGPETPPVIPQKKSVWIRWWMVLVFIAVAASVLFIVLQPAAIFSWDGDDLSEWVTEAEMTAVLQDVASRYVGSDLESEAVFDEESVELAGFDGVWIAGGWRVSFHNGDHDGRYEGPPTGTDPRLPQGVTYEAEQGFGWGHYVLLGLNSDEMISVWVRPAGTSFGYPPESEVEAHKDMTFAVATMMLREMGWAD